MGRADFGAWGRHLKLSASVCRSLGRVSGNDQLVCRGRGAIGLKGLLPALG